MTSSLSYHVVFVSNGEKATSTDETVKQPTATFVEEESDRKLRHRQLTDLDKLLDD
jgi:hypothetical protein